MMLSGVVLVDVQGIHCPENEDLAFEHWLRIFVGLNLVVTLDMFVEDLLGWITMPWTTPCKYKFAYPQMKIW